MMNAECGMMNESWLARACTSKVGSSFIIQHSSFGGAVAAALAFIAALAFPGTAPAQTYPAKPIRYIVGYTPAGTADMLARAVGQKLAEAWGQQVIVENRPGGGTNIATEMVAKSPPDGYTLFMPTVANAINPTLLPRLGHDPLRDFIYITNFAKVPGIVVCHPSIPVRNAKELIVLAKAKPDALRHGSTGIGSPHTSRRKYSRACPASR